MILFRCHVFYFVEGVEIVGNVCMKFNYESLNLTQDIHKLVKFVYNLSELFPDHERFGLYSQMRRASTSILLNIAEGSARSSSAEFSRFVKIAIGSLVEVDACLKLAVTLNFITEIERSKVDPLVESTFYKLVGLKKSQENK